MKKGRKRESVEKTEWKGKKTEKKYILYENVKFFCQTAAVSHSLGKIL